MFKCWTITHIVLGVALAVCLTAGNLVLAEKGGKGGGKGDDGGPRVICINKRKGDTGQVVITDENGGNSFTVVAGLDIGYAARWSPDGQWLGGYHSNLGGEDSVMMIRADGTDEHVVVTYSEVDAFNVANGKKSKPNGGIADVTWGPDGTMIFQADVVYTVWIVPPPEEGDPFWADFFTARLFKVDVATGDITQLTDGNGNYLEGFPHYCPALDKIVFVSYRVNQRAELFAINPDGSDPQQLTNLQGPRIWHATWDHAGTQLAVSLQTPGGVGANSDLWIFDVDFSSEVPATPTYPLAFEEDKTEIGASWAPDDNRLVFARWWRPNSRTKRYQIVSVAPLNPADETVIADTKNSSVHSPDWNPVPPGT